MSSSDLTRLGGLAALTGGILFVVVDLLALTGDPNDPVGSVTSFSYALTAALSLIAGVLVLGGLVSLYEAQAASSGLLGLAGFAGAFVGTALSYGVNWFGAFATPSIARAAPRLLEGTPPGPLNFGYTLSFVVLAVGWALFGVATLRSGVYPRGAAILLIAASVFYAFPLPFAVATVGAVVWGLAVAWLGLSLLIGSGAAAQQQPSRTR